MAAVVAGDADLRRGAEQRARLARVAIVLPEMDAVGAEPFGEADAVVDDERHVARAADFQERLGKARTLLLIDLFDAELEPRHRHGLERTAHPPGHTPGPTHPPT